MANLHAPAPTRRNWLLRLAVTAVTVGSLVQCSKGPGESMVGPGGNTGGSNVNGGGAASSQAGTLNISVSGNQNAGGADGTNGPCQGLECYQTSCSLGDCKVPACASGQKTTISGTVFDPAGKVPLYNVVVYVPNGAVPPFSTGASCDRCDASISNPVAATLTDTHGAFTLDDVPVMKDVPLVIQVGKWRRQLTIPTVTACADTPLMDPNVTRLPRNKKEGDIPLIAITTGGADSMECLPRRMGIDDAEITTEAGAGRIHLYSGQDNNADTIATKAFAKTLNAGAALTPATTLWGTKKTLSAYDIVIMSCEGATLEDEKPKSARQAMYDYAAAGGRVFASHWHHIWFSGGPAPVPSVGTWLDREDPQDPAIGMINTSFPKGADFADWLVNVQASTTKGQLSINVARDNLQAVNEAEATSWISIPSNDKCQSGCTNNKDLNNTQKAACVANCKASPGAIEYVSFNTPLKVPPAEQCGRVVFTDLHVSATGTEAKKKGAPFPEGCEMRDLSAQEKAVEFMLFDLSSCIQDDHLHPRPPKVF